MSARVTLALSAEQAGLLEAALRDYAGLLDQRVAAAPTLYCTEAKRQPEQVREIASAVGGARMRAEVDQLDPAGQRARLADESIDDVIEMMADLGFVFEDGESNNSRRIAFEDAEDALTAAWICGARSAQ